MPKHKLLAISTEQRVADWALKWSANNKVSLPCFLQVLPFFTENTFNSSVLITFSGTFASEARVLSVVEESFPLRQIWGQGDQEATGKKSREEPWSHPKDC